MRKKAIAIILLIPFILSACSNAITGVQPTNQAIEKNNANAPLLENPYSSDELILHFYDNSSRDQDDMTSLENYILDQLDIKIKIHSIKDTFFTNDVFEKDSLISLDNYTYKNYMEKKRDYFLPLEDILAENEIFSVLPDEYKECLKDDYGHIWCIPRFYDTLLNIRVYSNKLLDSLNCKPPATLDEFTGLLVMSYENFGDDITLLKTSQNTCLSDFYDIFECYGLEIQNGTTIGYNMLTKQYEDFYEKADIKGLLEYFSFLINNDLLVVMSTDEYKNGDKSQELIDGSLLTYKTLLSYMGSPSDYYTLSLNGTGRVSVELFDKSMIFIGKGTSNPKEVLDLYLNTFYGSNKANIIGTYGESGHRVNFTDYTQVELRKLNYEQMVHAALEGDMPYTASLCGTGFYNDYLRVPEGMNSEEKEIREATYKEYIELRNNSFKDGLLKIIPPFKEIQDMDFRLHYEVFKVFKTTFYEFLIGKISIDEFDSEYNLRMEKLDLDHILEDLNER